MPEYAAGSGSAGDAQPWQVVNGGVGFQNSWADVGTGDPCAYRLVPAMNAVEIRGLLAVPTFAADSTIFTLPAGYRPGSLQSFVAGILNSTGTVAVKTPRIYVALNGNVVAANASIPGASSGLTTQLWLTAYVSLDF